MSDQEQSPCSLVYPPEWDTMTADEQMLWFLAQLSAQMDSIKSEFAAARAGDPVGATSQVDLPASPPPATATSSHIDLASTTTSPTIDEEVHDTSPESSLDSNRHVPDTGMDEHTWVEDIPEVVTELAVLPGTPSSTTEARVVPHDASEDSINDKPVTCSTECSNQDNNTRAFPPSVMTVPLLSTAAPMLVTDLIHSGTDAVVQPFRNHDLDVSPGHAGLLIRASPWPSFLVDHIAEGNEVRPTPWSSFQMHFADGNDVRPAPWPSFAGSLEGTTLNYEGLLLQVTYVVQRLPVALNFLREYWRYLPSVRLKSFEVSVPLEKCDCVHLVSADGNEVRPIPWPSFLIGRFMKHLIMLVQVHDSGLISSRFLMELSHVGNLVCGLLGNGIRIFPGQLLCLWSLQQDEDDSCLNTHVKLFHYSKQWFSELCAFAEQEQLTFLVSTKHDCGSEMICYCAHPGTNSNDFTIQSDLPSSFEQLQCGVAWTLSFVRKTTVCRPCLRHDFQFLLPSNNPREVHGLSELQIVEFIEHQFINHVHISELAGCFCLEKLWGAGDIVHQSQEQWNLSEHHFLEQAATCNIPWHEKLLGTMRTMSMYWLFLSQREYKRSDHLDMNCNSKQMIGGSGARIPLTVLLVPFEFRSSFGEIMLGGNAYQQLMVHIATAFPSDLPAKYLFDDTTGPVHHLIQKPIVAKLQQHVTEPGNYFALFQLESPRPLNIIILAQLSCFSKKAICNALDAAISFTCRSTT
ncbi:hypothetical protein CFC21_001610 [Triticum aestivum]|uniref:Uncharacterized protein n=1 Tax=Triticum aestivum TaxID=4565 RepID=A0A3B5XY89_WHEAT|nr:hypothetical protein CFC21_001610 [Triticum aestivum]